MPPMGSPRRATACQPAASRGRSASNAIPQGHHPGPCWCQRGSGTVSSGTQPSWVPLAAEGSHGPGSPGRNCSAPMAHKPFSLRLTPMLPHSTQAQGATPSTPSCAPTLPPQRSVTVPWALLGHASSPIPRQSQTQRSRSALPCQCPGGQKPDQEAGLPSPGICSLVVACGRRTSLWQENTLLLSSLSSSS